MDSKEDQTVREDFLEAYKDLKCNDANKKKFVECKNNLYFNVFNYLMFCSVVKRDYDLISRVDISNLIDELMNGQAEHDSKVAA